MFIFVFCLFEFVSDVRVNVKTIEEHSLDLVAFGPYVKVTAWQYDLAVVPLLLLQTKTQRPFSDLMRPNKPVMERPKTCHKNHLDKKPEW